MNNTPEEFLSAIEVIIDDCEYGKINTDQCLSDIKNCLFVYGKTIQPDISPTVPDDVADAIKFCKNFADIVTAEVDLDKENRYYHMLHDTPFRELGENINTLIRAASTPSADTIAVPKEVLQGVREALAIILKTHDTTCKGEECQISGIDIGRVYLASLDAALSEGE